MIHKPTQRGEDGKTSVNQGICRPGVARRPGMLLALLLHMRYHEGKEKVHPHYPGHNSMKQQRPLHQWLAVLALLFVPLAGSGQEHGSEEAKKKSETASPPSDLTKVETSEERRKDLDNELDSSLSEFDALILREQEILEQRREAEAAAGGGGGAGTAEAGGGEAGDEGAEGGDETEAASQARGTGGSPDDPSGEEVGEEEGARPEGSEAETGEVSNGRIPPDVGDGSDDDIVAGQLREAAMKEEDPELREKLWDEYRAYKFGEKKKTEK